MSYLTRELPSWINEKRIALEFVKKQQWNKIEDMLQNESSRDGTIFALWQVTQEKVDIAPIIGALVKLIKKDQNMVPKIIVLYYLNNKDGKKLAEILDVSDIREYMFGAIWVVVGELKISIMPILDKLEAGLNDQNPTIRTYAATALAHYYQNRKMHSKIAELTKNNNREVRDAVQTILND